MKNGFVQHSTDSAPEGSRAILDGVRKAWGFVPNLHKVLAESPAALEAYSSLWGTFEKTSLSPVERNVAYLAIIYENECEYCMAGHTGLSKMAGVEPEHIEAIRQNRRIDNEKLEALRIFAAKVTRHRGFLSEADVAAFKAAGYDNRAVLDVLVGAATKLISNYTNHLADTPNDAFMAGNEWTAPSRREAAA